MELGTYYPILFVHGTGFRDRKLFCYWGRVPKVLKSGGARVYFGHQDAWGTIEDNAKTLATSLDKAKGERALMHMYQCTMHNAQCTINENFRTFNRKHIPSHSWLHVLQTAKKIH